jgi:acyl carrier protein
MTKEAVFDKLNSILVSEFDLKPEAVRPEAHLYEDLDLDSIDAVDMVVKMKEFIPGKIDPALFKTARTVQDVVDLLYPLIQGQNP